MNINFKVMLSDDPELELVKEKMQHNLQDIVRDVSVNCLYRSGKESCEVISEKWFSYGCQLGDARETLTEIFCGHSNGLDEVAEISKIVSVLQAVMRLERESEELLEIISV